MSANNVDCKLLEASAKGEIQAIKEALAAGANAYAVNDVEKTTLQIAEERKHVECVSLLREAVVKK